MRIRHRTNRCLNCDRSIGDVYNYCPYCGQENTTTNLSFGILFKEFFSNYFSFDSRFGRTIKPFLIKPGLLTIAFNEGKRVMYAHPIRLYLIVSLFQFFLFSWVIGDEQEGTTSDILNVTEESREELAEVMKLPPEEREYDPDNWPLQEWEMQLIAVLVDDEASQEVILDSLNTSERPLMDRLVIRQIVKLSDSTAGDVFNEIIENIPVMMFFILPLYALLLKLFYFRKGLYIHHLIHSLHIHSFLFLIMGIGWIFSLALDYDEDTTLTIVSLIVSVYIVLSFRKVYHQKWITTIFKFLTLGFAYVILLGFALVFEILISLALY